MCARGGWATARLTGVRIWAWVVAVATHTAGCGQLTQQSESDTACSAGCAHEFDFDVPGGAYIVRARLTARVHGDLDYGPAEYARVLVDGNQHGPNCFGSENQWISCADQADVTGLLSSRNGASRARIKIQSSAGVSTFSAQVALVLDLSVKPWLGPITGGTQVAFGSGCSPARAQGSSADWTCVFTPAGANGAGAETVPAASDPASGGAVCTAPALGASGWYNVTVRAAGVDVSPTMQFYAYGAVTSATMHAINMVGTPEANTAVRLSSIDLDALVSLTPIAVLDRGRGFEGGCAFGATYTNLVYDFAADTYACLSPAGTGSVPLTSIVLNSQQHAFLPGVTLTRSASLSSSIGSVQSVTPIAVPRIGGTSLSVRTNNLVGTDYRCLFDQYAIVNADFSAIDDRLNCTFPRTAYHRNLPHTLSLQVASDAVHFSNDITTLSVYSVSSLHCAYGPAAGGHVIVVHGSGFIDETNGLISEAADANRKYKFAHDVTAYIPLNGTTNNITIVSPPGVAGTKVAVDVTFIANEPQCQNSEAYGCYTEDEVLYSYFFVGTLFPTSGPISGGTNVTVTGLDFGTCERLSCRFGVKIVDAILINSSALWCTSPPLQAGTTSVDVSMNGVDFSAAALKFVYYNDPAVTHIVPSRGSQYSCSNVSVHGVNFTNGSQYTCRFDSEHVFASLSMGIIDCACTASALPRTVVLEVSLNGQQYTSSGATYEFSESQVLSLSASSGAATGFSTVDASFSFPGPPWLQYQCIWNGYPTIGEFIPEAVYDNEQGVPVGTVRCVTPRADAVPFTYGRTSFEEAAASIDAVAQLSAADCRSENLVGELSNVVDEAVVVFGQHTTLLYSTQGLQFGQGRWEMAFQTFRRNATTEPDAGDMNSTSATNLTTASNATESELMCPKQYVGVVQNFTDMDGTTIRPHSGQHMYMIHGSQGFVQVELESVNLTNTPQHGGADLNATFSCWMRIGNRQTTNNAKIWIATDTGDEISVWQMQDTEQTVSISESPTKMTIFISISVTADGRASAAAISATVEASIPSNFGNATVSGHRIELSAYTQVMQSTAIVADSSNILREWDSAQGQAARAQFQFGAAVVAGVEADGVNISSAVTAPGSSGDAEVVYTVTSGYDIFSRFAVNNISAVLATSINSAGTQLDLQPSDIALETLSFSTVVTFGVKFEVNRTDNVSDIVDELVSVVTNQSQWVDSLRALNASSAANIANVISLNVSATNATFGEFVAEPEPEPDARPGQEVDQYRVWQEFSVDVDTSAFASAILKFGASLELGNESYFFDSCKIYHSSHLPATVTLDVKALHGMTVDGAEFSLHAPYIVSIYPASGIITGDTLIRAEINYPGISSSVVNCSFNGVLQPASYLSVSPSAGVVLCTSPHLEYCAADQTCIKTESLSTLSLPAGVALHIQIDGVQSSNSVVFAYGAVPHLSYIWPVSGVSSENILIVGEGLSQGTDYRVRFGENVVQGLYQENSCEAGNCRVLCDAPGGNAGTVVAVEISLNGQQFTASGATFTYTDVNECISSPCLHGADCLESADTPDVAVGQFSCICTGGWQGDRCHVDVDECSSGPCRNSATCTDSTDSGVVPVGSYKCDCAAGWNGTHCDIDVNECLSHPCLHGGSCSDSTSLQTVLPFQFACSCVPGYIDVVCSTDVDECTSNPCMNGATCTESSQLNSTVPVDAYSCSCAAGFANGLCAYAFVAEYAENCTVQLGGHCDVDVDECVSQPCKNGAFCEDSSTTQQHRQRAIPRALGVESGNVSDSQMRASTVKFGAPSCSASNGRLNMGVDGWPDFTAAWCPEYASSSEYLEIQFLEKKVITAIATQGRYNTGQWTTRFSLMPSEDGNVWSARTEPLIGNVDESTIVYNELLNPLIALCLRLYPEQWHAWPSMRVELFGFSYGPVRFDAFSCTCTPGYANGVCDYAYPDHIADSCNVVDGGTCGTDADECASGPCENGATCLESSVNASIPLNAYSCTCMPGFADGVCAYQHIANVDAMCHVEVNGTCGVDVNECLSNPCQNGGTCEDSTSSVRLSPARKQPLQYIVGESELSLAGSLGLSDFLSSITHLVDALSGQKFSVVSAGVFSMDVSTELRLIVPDHSRQFGEANLAGNRSREQLRLGLTQAMAAANPVVSILSTRYSSSFSALPGKHTWIKPAAAIPVGLEAGSTPGIPNTAFYASSHLRGSVPPDHLTVASNARLNGEHEWVSEALQPSPAPVGLASGAISDVAIKASSAYYVQANMATWNSISAIINSAEELQDWLGSSSSGLSNPNLCVTQNGVQLCQYACVEAGSTFPMYLGLDLDHGHAVDVDETITSFMRWRHPEVQWNGWRHGTRVSGDMRGRALFVSGVVDVNGTLRSENEVTVTGHSSFEVSPDLGDVRFPAHNARLNSATQWLPMLEEDPRPWLQVDLGREARIAGIATQGAAYGFNEWVTSFSVSWSTCDTSISQLCELVSIDKSFTGNSDRTTSVDHWLPEVVVARFIRLYVLAWYRFPALRVEIYEDIVWSGNEWIEVDLSHEVVLTGLATQGAFDRDEWVTAFSVSYTSDLVSWVYCEDSSGAPVIFPGNQNASTHYTTFPAPIEARYVRLHVRDFYQKAALRLELYREPLNYYVVDASITSPHDTSHIVYDPAFVTTVAAYTTSAGDTFTLPDDDMSIFEPVLAADVIYNFTVLLNKSRSVNLTRLREDLSLQLHDTSTILDTIQSILGRSQVYDANVTQVKTNVKYVENAPEPEPEPDYVSVHSYLCSCSQGWANGVCAQGFIAEYTVDCTRLEGGHCDLDVDECASSPCQNGATCVDLSSLTGAQQADEYACLCVAGFADGLCEYDYIDEYAAHCNVSTSGNCGIDVNECASHPCTNLATCLDSTSFSTPSVPAHAYRCVCAPGYANGTCDYAYIGSYAGHCALATGGDCGLDVDECTSNPCMNGATCTESSQLNSTVPVDAYSCSCAAGFANGLCAYAFVAEYAENCTIQLGGHCDVDVDECVSQPCKNGAECAESGVSSSILPNLYTCSCAPGYASGLCSYDFIVEYSLECSLSSGGHCDIDVDECASSACKSNSLCIESSLLRHRRLIISEYMEGTAYNDAIEIFNPTCRDVDLSEYSIWKVSNGQEWGEDSSNSVQLQGSLAQGQTFVLCNKQFDMTLTASCDYVAQTTNGINFDGDDAIALVHGTAIIDTIGQAGVDPGNSWTLAMGSASTRQHTLQRKSYVVTGNTNWSLASGKLTSDSADLEWTGTLQVAGSNSAASLGSHQADLHCDRYALNSYVCICQLGWTGENCEIDVDECASNPCQNSGICKDSSTEATVAVDAYHCICASGFANGTCHGEIASVYADVCNLQIGGYCDIDMNECASSPCQNGAACSDSSTNSSISLDAFRCSCAAGYAGGLCTFDFIEEYRALCHVLEGGRCDVDINECASHPCLHGATCTDSGQANSSQNATAQIAVDAFSCACKIGYANGVCDYTYIQSYTAACAVQTGGRCDVDVDECSSSPCVHTSDCYDSSSDASIGPGYYSCSCKPGYEGAQCQHNINECSSIPCINNGTCNDLLQTYSCSCLRGWDGDECEIQIDPCERDEDDCSEHATCIKTSPGSHICNCHRGYALKVASANLSVITANMCLDIDECQSRPCSNGATCGDLIDAYNCTCVDGYMGWTCEIDVDECNSYPCANGATCVNGVANFSCTCGAGFVGRSCAVDFDECSLNPCSNGAICDESSTSSRIAPSFFACTCAPGFTGDTCMVDVDECDSQPCLNGATCTESASDIMAVVPDSYHCSCAPGFAEGWCSYAFMPSYLNACRNVSGGHCGIDVDECSSHPCTNGATCTESSQLKSVLPNAYSCSCAPGFANGKCEYDFIPEYRSVCSIATAGRCDIDVDECASIPCQNGGRCIESSSNQSVPVHFYTCECRPGFANGWCEGTQLEDYVDQCAKQFGGRCDVDIDECSSRPCQNGGTCSDSSTDATVAIDSYKCTCVSGFANGMCHYLFVRNYSVQCSLASGGACDVDVDECVSDPCQNGATCVESRSDKSVSSHAYRCSCVAGFANGQCSYDYVRQFESLCTILESDPAASLNDRIGNCDVDVDECASAPCQNGALCSDSTATVDISKHAYRCTCAAGFSNGMCEYDFIAEYASQCSVTESTQQASSGNCDMDVDECSSNPCVNGAICSGKGIDAFQCKCVAGYDGYVCSIDVAECASEPCLNGGACSEANLGPDQYACTCNRGFTGRNCAVDIDECASTPCQYPAPCTDGIDSFRCGAPLEVQLILALDLVEWNQNQEYWSSTLKTKISDQLGVDIARIKIVGVGSGSVTVDVQILPSVSDTEVGLQEAGLLFEKAFVVGSVAVGGVPVVGAEVGNRATIGCPDGFQGLDCSIDSDECASDPCAHLGSCIDQVAGYRCHCQIGWTGENCQDKLQLGSDFKMILSEMAILCISVGATTGPVVLYVLMTRVNFDINTDHFSYSAHAVSSTMAAASAMIGSITFVSYVRPATAGLLIHFRMMAPLGNVAFASLATPCPEQCGHAGSCVCPMGYEVVSAMGSSLCTAGPTHCSNNTYQFCLAVVGDSGSTESLTVDTYESCDGPCARVERNLRMSVLLLGLCLAAVSMEWASVVSNGCTHLHRVPACMPRWEWMLPPMFLVFIALKLICTALQASVAVLLWTISREFADLLLVNCFEEDSVFVLKSVEELLGMAFGTCMVNILTSLVNFGIVAVGFALARVSQSSTSVGYLQPRHLMKLPIEAKPARVKPVDVPGSSVDDGHSAAPGQSPERHEHGDAVTSFSEFTTRSRRDRRAGAHSRVLPHAREDSRRRHTPPEDQPSEPGVNRPRRKIQP